MELDRSPEGDTLTLTMTVGEAIALRDQLAAWHTTLVGGKSQELHEALESLIPQRLALLEPRKASGTCSD
jgi:hypothetical protein